MGTDDYLFQRIQTMEKELNNLTRVVNAYAETLFDQGLLDIKDPRYKSIDNQRYNEYLQSGAETNEHLEIT